MYDLPKFFFVFQMEGITVQKFYGRPKLQQKLVYKDSIRLVVKTLRSEIFKSLRFPVRQRSSVTIKVPILDEDRLFFGRRTIDQVLATDEQCPSDWHQRVVSECLDINYLIPSEIVMRVKKVRSEKELVIGPDGKPLSRDRHHGYQLTVKLVRHRKVGLKE